MTQEFCEKVINEIKAQKVCPRPCWYYQLKRLALWLTIILAIVVIGWALSIDWYLLGSYDWELAGQTNLPLWRHIVMAIPYLWIIFAGLTIWLVIKLSRQADNVYRWSLFRVLAIVLLIGGVIGLVSHLLKGDETLHGQMMRSALYRASVFTNEDLGSRPDWGILTGRLIEHRPGGIKIQDYNGNVWNISNDQIEDFDNIFANRPTGTSLKLRGMRIDACQSEPIFKAHWFQR
jgi:hypothetical protein